MLFSIYTFEYKFITLLSLWKYDLNAFENIQDIVSTMIYREKKKTYYIIFKGWLGQILPICLVIICTKFEEKSCYFKGDLGLR